MSDKETAKGQGPADQQTRKSNRQKTPNTYYNNEIQDTRGETKPKQGKAAGTGPGAATTAAIKQSRQKKKNDKTKQPQAHSLLQQFQMLQNKPRGNSYSEHNNISVPSGAAHQDGQEIEAKSNPASDAAEISSSPRMSPKSCENNPNRSFSENDDQLSNKNNGASYKTHKIHKKPKFQDEKYNDNMLLSKGLLAKRSLKLPKTLTIKSRGEQIDGNLATPQGIKTANSKNRKSSLVMSAATGESGKQKDNGADKKKDKSDDFLKGGLLDIFLDAVTGVNNSGQEQFGDSKISNQHSANIQGGSQIETQVQREGDNQLDKKQQFGIYGDSAGSLKRTSSKASVDGDGFPLRKKLKKEGRKQTKGEETPGESQNSSLISGIVKNGTIYNYPNIRSKSDCITHVERSKEKLVLHHSSFAPMEMNRIYLKDEVSSKIDLPKLIQSITINQIINNSANNKQSGGNINSEKLSNHAAYSNQNKNKSNNNSSQKQTQQFPPSAQQMNNLLTTQKTAMNNNNNTSNPSSNNNQNGLQIPQTLTMLQNLLQQGAQQTQQMNDKSTFFQYALLQLQQKSLENLQQQPTFQPSQQGALPLQSMLEAAAQVGLLNTAKNNNFNKMRSQSYEFDSSLAQRRLSEHFKISRRYSSAEEEAEIKRKGEAEKERKKSQSQIEQIKENKEGEEDDKLSENNTNINNQKDQEENIVLKEDNQETINQEEEQQDQEMEVKEEMKQNNADQDLNLEKEEKELANSQEENEQDMNQIEDSHGEEISQNEVIEPEEEENQASQRNDSENSNLQSEDVSRKEEKDVKEEQQINEENKIEEETLEQQQLNEIEQKKLEVNAIHGECDIQNQITHIESSALEGTKTIPHFSQEITTQTLEDQTKQQDEIPKQEEQSQNLDNTHLLNKELQEEPTHETTSLDNQEVS